MYTCLSNSFQSIQFKYNKSLLERLCCQPFGCQYFQLESFDSFTRRFANDLPNDWRRFNVFYRPSHGLPGSLVCPAVYVKSVCLSGRLSVRPYVCPAVCLVLSAHRVSIQPYVRPSVRPLSVRPSVRPSVRSPVRPSIRPSARQSDRPPVRPSVRPSI